MSIFPNFPRCRNCGYTIVSCKCSVTPFPTPDAPAARRSDEPEAVTQRNKVIEGMPEEPTKYDDDGYPIVPSELIRGQAKPAFVRIKDYDALRDYALKSEGVTQSSDEGLVERLSDALRGMLLSADCSWENNNQGHDWPEACEKARAALRVTQQREK